MLALTLQVATLALGVAISPLPLVAVIVLLLTKRARFSSLVLLIAWISGVALALAIAMAFAGRIHPPAAGTDYAWEGLFSALIGVGLVTTGVLTRRGRHQQGKPEQPPAWVSSVDNLSPMGGAVVVFLNATTSPKNLALAITAGALITKNGLNLAEAALEVVLYLAVASLTLAVPVALYFVGGNKSVAVLERWKAMVTAHAAAVMEIILFLLGIGMTARGLFNLLG
ncbi:MAG: hypothetical protein HGB10_02795 [Coriobacteriia bacterium]|nr:hypothetical protein [Coriobacteriia bacterium]